MPLKKRYIFTVFLVRQIFAFYRIVCLLAITMLDTYCSIMVLLDCIYRDKMVTKLVSKIWTNFITALTANKLHLKLVGKFVFT